MAGNCVKRPALLFVVLCAAPMSAHAHLVQTGFGSFYDGIAHLAMTPQDVMIVLGIAMLAGLHSARASRGVLCILPASWLAGELLGGVGPDIAALHALTTVSFGLVGLFVALNLKFPAPVVLCVACTAGLLHGYVDGATLTRAGGREWLALLGSAVAVFVVATLVPAVIVSLREGWTRIAVRVAGSWIAAIGMLMLGWLVRGNLH